MKGYSLMVKQSTHNRSSESSILSNPTIDQLRKQGKWPFPEWKDGKIVPVKVRKPRQPKPNWFKEDAPF